MDAPTVTLEPASGDAIHDVEALLERNDLPAEDVQAKPDCFYVARAGDDRVGVGGLEVHGTDGLLRSVVVAESARGRGFGTALVEALESEARAAGVERLFLLTTTAAGFFAELGYDEVPRTAPPERIRETAEFSDLCPDSATCMAGTP